MRIPGFISLSLLLTLMGCEGEIVNWQPPARFDAVVVRRPFNLLRVLGPHVTLAGPEDTLHLRLAYDARTSRNILTDEAADTVLAARVFRFRGLYYFVQTKPEAATWVHAVRIRRGEIRGLTTSYQQMWALSSRVQHGDFAELVRFRNPAAHSFRLRFDRKELRAFYLAQADSSPVYRLLLPASQAASPPISMSTARPTGPYPNPARELTTLDFEHTSSRTVTLYDDRGHLWHTYPANGLQLTFSVAGLPAGRYLMRVSQDSSGGVTTTHRLVVEK